MFADRFFKRRKYNNDSQNESGAKNIFGQREFLGNGNYGGLHNKCELLIANKSGVGNCFAFFVVRECRNR